MRTSWSDAEISLLKQLYSLHGTQWQLISKGFPYRSADSIRNFVDRHIDHHVKKPRICKKSSQRLTWTEDEDKQIAQYVAQYGRKWRNLCGYLPGRSAHAIRNRYARLMEFKSAYSVMVMSVY